MATTGLWWRPSERRPDELNGVGTLAGELHGGKDGRRPVDDPSANPTSPSTLVSQLLDQ